MVRLTTSGGTVLATGLVLVPVWWLTGYPQLAALAVGCAVALALALVSAPAPALDFSARWVATSLTERDSAVLVVSTHNGRRRPHPATTVTLALSGLPDPIEASVPALTAGESHELLLRTPALPRGAFRVRTLTMEGIDVLGLVRRRRPLGCDLSLLVRPRTVELRPTRRQGEDAAAPRGQRRPGDVFHSLREYQPGDDLRLIHWMATARTRTPVVRELVQVDTQRHALVLDTSVAAHRSGSFEEAVRVAGSLARAGAGDDLWFLTTGGLRRRCAAGKQDTVLDLLAVVHPVEDADDAGIVPWRASSVTVVTGPEADIGRWRSLAGRRNLLVVAVGPGGTTGRSRGGPRVVPVPRLADLAGQLRGVR